MKKTYLNEMGVDVTAEVEALKSMSGTIEELKSTIAELEQEVQEQARLLGISGSKELALMTKIQDQALNYLSLDGQAKELMRDATRYRWLLRHALVVVRDVPADWTCWLGLAPIPFRSKTIDPSALLDELMARFRIE